MGKYFSRKTRNMINLVVFVACFMGVITWSVGYIERATRTASAEAGLDRTTAQYVNYWVGNGYISSESNAAIAAYILEHPEPQNVKVLTGYTTAEVWGYMTTYFAGGLQQDCSYCHVYENFGAETADEYLELGGTIDQWQNKMTARKMLEMTADLNQNWITQLGNEGDKVRSGAQIVCATCHLGQANFEAWPAEQHALPDDYRLPIGDTNNDGVADVADIDHMLAIVGNDEDYSLDSAQYNQNTMYHMNESLGVGCTHCHNSRYFPSWEQPAKYYAYTMLQMTQHLQNEYSDSIMNGQDMSCVMCHRNQIRPPGAANSEEVIPLQIGSSYDGTQTP